MGDVNQGIVHIIGPELGSDPAGNDRSCAVTATPSTHGAFGALAFGIGTSEVEHVLATQTLPQKRPKTMAVVIDGELADGVTAKDVALSVIRTIGTAGGVGHVIEYRGSVIRALSMEARMTVCNMSIEAGARAGMVAPDDTTFAYVEGRAHAPAGAGLGEGARRLAPTRDRRRGALRHRSCGSTAPRYAPASPGGRTPRRSSRSTTPCPIRIRSADPVGPRIGGSGRSPTWDSSLAPR